ncbi:MAG: transcription termination/antitermination NusG family protein [Armatimonadota bacterium]|nr:transcription termination/antitermination NusG family protein [Armatimonadota bacterium]MDR7454570.1 transcription termination/antitermination NusG family protein [Armatimonadota bacterium]MDR7495811.1 transcription termination/antitermination NusG family protein [Armatimonadota bacterium]MDR7511467.1 transcription termination/antitermination NusG family protein [Armatimonadota bacterium]
MGPSGACGGPTLVGPGGAAWFVIQTKPRAEYQAQQFLHRSDVPTFLPRLLVRRRHGSRRWHALEPLFPGYLFCHFLPVPEAIARVRWTPGVRCLLGDDDGPIPIDRDIVDYLRAREVAHGYIAAGRPLAAGDRVRFVGGPFALLEGIIERQAGRVDRVRVLLLLMGTSVVVEVDEAVLERC